MRLLRRGNLMGEEGASLGRREAGFLGSEGGRRGREVGAEDAEKWGGELTKKLAVGGDVLLALLPIPFGAPSASLFLLFDDQVDQEEDDDGADSAGQDRPDPAFAERGAEALRQ